MAEGAVVQNDRCPFAESKYAVMASLAENAVSLDSLSPVNMFLDEFSEGLFHGGKVVNDVGAALSNQRNEWFVR